MRHLRIFICLLSLILFTGCTGLTRSSEDEVEAAREAAAAQEAVAREMAEIEEAKQAAREKVRKDAENSSSEALDLEAAVGADSTAKAGEVKTEGNGKTQAAGQKDAAKSQTAGQADAAKSQTAGQTDAAKSQTAGQADAVQSQEVVPQSAAKAGSLRFRNKKLLDQHYNKHGIEMGFPSAEAYEAAAAAVVSKPGVMHKTEAEDGDDVYYMPASNEFVVVSTDGYIRTYFLPDSGIKYYNKQ